MFDGKKLRNLNQSIDLILRRARNSSETDNPEAPKLDTDTLSEHLNGKNSYLKRIILSNCHLLQLYYQLFQLATSAFNNNCG